MNLRVPYGTRVVTVTVGGLRSTSNGSPPFGRTITVTIPSALNVVTSPTFDSLSVKHRSSSGRCFFVWKLVLSGWTAAAGGASEDAAESMRMTASRRKDIGNDRYHCGGGPPEFGSGTVT